MFRTSLIRNIFFNNKTLLERGFSDFLSLKTTSPLSSTRQTLVCYCSPSNQAASANPPIDERSSTKPRPRPFHSGLEPTTSDAGIARKPISARAASSQVCRRSCLFAVPLTSYSSTLPREPPGWSDLRRLKLKQLRLKST